MAVFLSNGSGSGNVYDANHDYFLFCRLIDHLLIYSFCISMWFLRTVQLYIAYNIVRCMIAFIRYD